ncbi:hypothetical protein [Halosegnis sp.]|uniref:hypothetical protein n=1 Tax=Halosegnis sp. TaxID=2864959 RepID=UPI0035D3F58A
MSDDSDGEQSESADRRDAGSDAAASVAVVVGVALVVVAAAVVGASALGATSGPTVDASEDTNHEQPPAEYEPDAVIADEIPSEGSVAVSESLQASETSSKVIVFDGRVEPSDVRPLVVALTRAGHEVRFASAGLRSSLEEADAYVRVDPSDELSDGEVEAVREFTDDGGRVVLIGEPDRIRITQTGFFASLTTQQTRMTSLAGEYGIVFGTRYLYDTTTNDGNFKNVLAGATDAETAPDVDRVAMYTAARIDARGGQVVLRTMETTELSGGGAAEAYPVAVRKNNVLAVGDKTFLEGGRHNVADNEAFIGYLADFLVSGDRGPSFPEETATATPTPAEGGNQTATATPTPG